MNERAARKKERETEGLGVATLSGCSYFLLQFLMLIKLFLKNYDVVFNNSFRKKKMNRIQSHKKKFIVIF
jgi:hypothetical protein